jgi:micrococcal nuclease
MKRPALSFVALGAVLVIGMTACGVAPKPQVAVQAVAAGIPSVAPTPRATVKPTARPTPTPAPAPVFGLEPTGATQVGKVVKVTDGDTIKVDIGGTVYAVRYIGMDTPEVYNGVEWMGPEAAAANARLVAGKEVVLEKDVSETDQYDRLLRYVWVHESASWLLVNLELIRQGYAQVSTYPPDVKYTDALYVAAEQEAQAASLGLWASPPAPVAAAPTPAPIQQFVAPPVATPVPVPPAASNCEASYPGICIPIGSADLDCPDMYAQGISRFVVLWNVPNPDPHRFDGDGDGIGCEG